MNKPHDVELIIFQIMTSASANHRSYKYQWFEQSGCRDIGMRQFKFGVKTLFICLLSIYLLWFPAWKFAFVCTVLRTSLLFWTNYKYNICDAVLVFIGNKIKENETKRNICWVISAE